MDARGLELLSVNQKILFKSSYQHILLPYLSVWALLVALLMPLPAFAKYASIIVDAETGRILHGTNVDTRNYPASLTKMMTLYVVFDALDSGELKLNSTFTVSRRAAAQPASKLGLRKNQTISVENAILALVTKSANDVATTIAENISGSERAFALRMTSLARKLGMTRTTFRNASGLPHRGQLSTARDMAKLARALLTNHAKHYGYFSVKSFAYKGRSYKNHNKLLTSYEGVDGIKTGYIRASGFNLVASAKRGEQRLIGVVFGGNSSRHRNRHMTKLLNKGFAILDKKYLTVADKPVQSTKRDQVAAVSTPPASRTKETWTIQVGAFGRQTQAYEAAQTAVDLAPRLLTHGKIKVVPITNRSGRTLHRARIYDISKKQAYRACRTLKKKRMNCMEIRGKKPLHVASNG